MDANMINPFLQATLEIIRDVAHLNYKVQKIYKKKDEKGCGDVTGIIGLSGSGKGTVAVTFDHSTISYIVSKLLEMDAGSIENDMIVDTVGELANMITGRAVRILAEKGFDLELTVPTVVHGPGHTVAHQADGPKIAIPYTSEQGSFTVEFSFDRDMQPGSGPDPKTTEEAPSSRPAGQSVPDPAADAPAIENWGVPESE